MTLSFIVTGMSPKPTSEGVPREPQEIESGIRLLWWQLNRQGAPSASVLWHQRQSGLQCDRGTPVLPSPVALLSAGREGGGQPV